jgi:outer membrane protein assembly factor BamB
LPYADNTIDLVIVTDMFPSRPGEGISAQEILRVLRPKGKAFLGCAIPPFDKLRAAPSMVEGPLETELRRLVAQQGIRDAIVTKDAHGVWAEISKPLPASRQAGMPDGVDAWSHWMHGPDNNPVSLDTAIKAPYLTQWLGKPYYTAMPVVTTAAGGRIFVAMGHIAHHDREVPTLNTIFARNGYNGAVLWTRKLPEGYLVHRSAFIATDDTFFMIDKNSALLLDPQTGEEKGRIRVPDVDGEWKWMAMAGRTLFVLAGESDPIEPTTLVRSQRDHWSWGELSKGYYQQPRIPWGFATTIAAYDMDQKKRLWLHREPSPVDSRAIGICDGRLFFYSPDSRIGCMDARSGNMLWTNADADLLRLVAEPGRKLWSTPGFRTCCTLLCTPKALFLEAQTQMNVVAISAQDGKFLWKKTKTRSNPNLLFVGEKLVVAGIGPKGNTMMVEPMTGEIVKDLNFGKVSCTRMTACPDSFFCRGEGLGRYDRLKGEYTVDGSARPGCMDGAIPANGLLYVGPWLCDCNLSLIGTMTLCSAKDFRFDYLAKEEERLERAQGDISSVKPVTVTQSDWPTYRANNERSAASKAAVPSKVEMLWAYKARTPVEPTAPVAADGLLFVCGSDGKVLCIEMETGKVRWSFATGGAIRWPPSIWEGRAFVGSGDGYIYAIEAANGRLLWRFRAAPIQRRIMVYDSLCSTWPVNSGVLVQDGIACAAAGIIDRDGTYVYALDAKTGKIKWQNCETGHLNKEIRKGVSVQGCLTFAKGQLWMAGGNQVSPASYDAQTGRYIPGQAPMGRPSAPRGCEVGVFRKRYVMHGGRLMYSGDGRVVSPAQFSFLEVAEDGSRTYPEVIPFQRSSVPPAWDEDSFAMLTERYSKLVCWDADRFEAALKAAKEELAQTRISDPRRRQGMEQALAARIRALGRWGPVEGEVLALAMGANAVAIVSETPRESGAVPTWEVRALDKKDGHILWQQPLPSEPLLNGLLIDRKGSIIVVLKDGGIVCCGGKREKG